jgi:hypothetical protein
MRRLAVTLTALSLLVSAGATAATAGGGGAPPPFPRLATQWSHADINVRIRRAPHTMIIDRGKIVQAAATQITLRESDGTIWVIPIDDQTLIVVDRLTATATDLQRKMSAQTMRIDGGAAVRVVATSK